MHSPWSDVRFGNDPAQSLRSSRKSRGDSESAWDSESVCQERKQTTQKRDSKHKKGKDSIFYLL